MKRMDFGERCVLAVLEFGTEQCWRWPGYHNPNGYGYATDPETTLPVTAHRLAYEMLRGPVGELFTDHLCRNRWCWNPWHIEPVTPKENSQRGARGRMVTRCAKGHEYTPENTALNPSGHRYCKQCNRDKAAAVYYARCRANPNYRPRKKSPI